MYLIKTIALIYLLSTSVSALAAASGSSPKGKPFVEINGQIAEVKGQVRSLEERLSRLEIRLETVEDEMQFVRVSIEMLQFSTEELVSEIENINDDMTVLDARMAELDSELLELKERTENLESIDAVVLARMIHLEELMENLENVVRYEIITLEEISTQNSFLIAHLNERVEDLDSQLRLAQNFLSGTCPEGEVLVGFEQNTLACRTNKEPLSDVWEIYTFRLTAPLPVQLYYKNFYNQFWTEKLSFKAGIYCGGDYQNKISFDARVEQLPDGYAVQGVERGGPKTLQKFQINDISGGFSFEIANVARKNFVSYLMPRYAYPDQVYELLKNEERRYYTVSVDCVGVRLNP